MFLHTRQNSKLYNFVGTKGFFPSDFAARLQFKFYLSKRFFTSTKNLTKWDNIYLDFESKEN